MPKVTVVIPCYNHGQYLDDAVDSILAQTFDDYEIVVVNDGSTDPFTCELLANYDRPKTRVMHRENGRMSAARNTGIRATDSRYICTLDADDRFAPTFLEKGVTILDSPPTPDAGVVTCGVQNFGERTGTRFPSGGGLLDFLVRNSCAASALYRRKCWEDVGGYNEAMVRGYEDWDFWISVCEHGWLVHVVPEVLLYYRTSQSSMVVASDRVRVELVEQLIENHRVSYERHVSDVVVGKEQMLQEKEEELQSLRGSIECRAGWIVSHPFRAAAALVRRLQTRTGH